MTPLHKIIARQIAQTGPMPLRDYMALCLSHPAHGYYATRDPLGAAGDFTTAPEISQMFGELIGLSLAQAWIDQGAPSPFLLVELGPGRGALMADILRAARAAPGFVEAAEVWLVETSPVLRAEQARRVPGAKWADRLSEAPAGPTFLVANEFFDALPIVQLVHDRGAWRERVVAIEGEALRWGLRPAQRPLPPAPDGAVREICPLLANIGVEIAARIALRGGAAIIIDYGYLRTAPGDTLQALHKHAYDDVLAHPGEADLTAHVNFEALATAAVREGATAYPPLTQGDFLLRSGLLERAGALGAGKSHVEQESIRDAVERLAAPDQMGSLFKVLALTGANSPFPPFDSPG